MTTSQKARARKKRRDAKYAKRKQRKEMAPLIAYASVHSFEVSV